MRIKILEMAYKRPKVKDAIDDHVHQIVENWCLVWAAKRCRKHLEAVNHWVGELMAQLGPGLDKLEASGLSEKAQHKLIDEVLISDAKLDQPAIVEHMIRRKFAREGFSDILDAAVQAWIDVGLLEIRSLYRGEILDVEYERQLCTVE